MPKRGGVVAGMPGWLWLVVVSGDGPSVSDNAFSQRLVVGGRDLPLLVATAFVNFSGSGVDGVVRRDRVRILDV
jgi:hypothetical protein